MSATKRPRLVERMLELGLLIAAGVLVLVWPAALATTALASQRVVMIGSAFGPEEVALNRSDFDPEYVVDASAAPDVRAAQLRHEIASLYGLNPSRPTEVLFVPEDKLIRTEEDPSLVLLVRKPGEYVLQVQTVYWIARMVTFGAAGAALLLFGALMLLRRRARGGAGSEAPTAAGTS